MTGAATATDLPAGPEAGRLGRNYFRLFSASTISNLGDGIGVVAYPWLASAITRNPLLIALVAVVQRLPWLLFSLPAGVITDRHDRRSLMLWSNAARGAITLFVAFVVLARQGALPGPDTVADAATLISTDAMLYGLVLTATLLLGVGEVLYDNSAQTFMPSIVHPDDLEKANGRLWSIEQVANTFAGPPLAALLIAISFSLPFFVDAATFVVSAILIAGIRNSQSRSAPASPSGAERRPWKVELAEGFRWLWSHDLLRSLAIVLGLLNLLGMMSTATFVLFGQEVLDTSPTEFAILGTSGAVGGIVGGWTASAVARRIGVGPSLAITLIGGGAVMITIGLMTWWPAVWLLLGAYMFMAVLWNVITVSFRQTVIPDHLLGRVNSVYRFFGWGMMPVGAALGGLIVVLGEQVASREVAQRLPWLIAGALTIALFAYAGPRLTTARFAEARAAALEHERS
ncbi:MAG TPA: MFS transporter [Ilumatobacteraceae bacterium]|nr:MFS transporter [Ilumatobacteraceae bacterium]